jgi:transcription elongation factor Elf1
VAIKVKCPGCGGVLNVKDEMAGKRGKCPKCGQVIEIPVAEAAAEPVALVGEDAPQPEAVPAGVGGGFKCPFCGHQGPPTVKKKINAAGWVLFVVLLLFCIPLCWLPFVLGAFKDEERKCVSCGTKLG